MGLHCMSCGKKPKREGSCEHCGDIRDPWNEIGRLQNRLARLEDGIRALADELQGEVEQHDPNKSFDEYSGGLADKAEMVEDRLRTLLDGE